MNIWGAALLPTGYNTEGTASSQPSVAHPSQLVPTDDSFQSCFIRHLMVYHQSPTIMLSLNANHSETPRSTDHPPMQRKETPPYSE